MISKNNKIHYANNLSNDILFRPDNLIFYLQFDIGSKIRDWKRLENAKAITPDGRYIVGTGRNAGGYPQAYLVFLP
jgi:hypothetical protein